MPGSCPCRFALWRAHLSLPGRAGSPRPGRESVSKNVRTTAAPSHKEKSGVLKKFAFSFLAGVVAACTRCSGRTWRVNSQSFLNYAENIRRRLRAGFLRSGLEPEGPHNTTAVLSAKRVYHRLNESARRKINVRGDRKENGFKPCFSCLEQSCFLPSGGLLSFWNRAASASRLYPDPGVCSLRLWNPGENGVGLLDFAIPGNNRAVSGAFR